MYGIISALNGDSAEFMWDILFIPFPVPFLLWAADNYVKEVVNLAKNEITLPGMEAFCETSEIGRHH